MRGLVNSAYNKKIQCTAHPDLYRSLCWCLNNTWNGYVRFCPRNHWPHGCCAIDLLSATKVWSQSSPISKSKIAKRNQSSTTIYTVGKLFLIVFFSIPIHTHTCSVPSYPPDKQSSSFASQHALQPPRPSRLQTVIWLGVSKSGSPTCGDWYNSCRFLGRWGWWGDKNQVPNPKNARFKVVHSVLRWEWLRIVLPMA